jgi:hypothetical protein
LGKWRYGKELVIWMIRVEFRIPHLFRFQCSVASYLNTSRMLRFCNCSCKENDYQVEVAVVVMVVMVMVLTVWKW